MAQNWNRITVLPLFDLVVTEKWGWKLEDANSWMCNASVEGDSRMRNCNCKTADAALTNSEEKPQLAQKHRMHTHRAGNSTAVFFFLFLFFFFNTGKTHWKWHSKSQNLLWDKVLAHIFKLEIQTTNKSTMFRFCTHQKWRFKETTQWKSDVEELQWRRNGCKGCFIHHHTLYPSFHNAPFISNCFYSSPPVSSHFFSQITLGKKIFF